MGRLKNYISNKLNESTLKRFMKEEQSILDVSRVSSFYKVKADRCFYQASGSDDPKVRAKFVRKGFSAIYEALDYSRKYFRIEPLFAKERRAEIRKIKSVSCDRDFSKILQIS